MNKALQNAFKDYIAQETKDDLNQEDGADE